MDPALRCSISLASVLMLLALSASDNSKDKDECADSVVGLATCLPYVGGTAKFPTPDCCNGLKQLLKTNKKCLCVVIKDRNDPELSSFKINATLALSLPGVCNAPANISECPVLLKLPPNSPEAQIFYQFDHKNGTTTANSISPAGGPAPSVVPNPTTAPAGGAATSTPEIFLVGLLLLLALVV